MGNLAVNISTDNHEIIKDGCIVAALSDSVSFKILDLTYKFSFCEINNKQEEKQYSETSVDQENKTISFHIKILMDSINSIFSKRIEVGTFKDGSTDKKIYLMYCVRGLDGEQKEIRNILLSYTWYTDK